MSVGRISSALTQGGFANRTQGYGLAPCEEAQSRTQAIRRHALTNKDPTVIFASVALAWLMVYANRKSAKDHRNPNSLTVLIIISCWTTKAAKDEEDRKLSGVKT